MSNEKKRSLAHAQVTVDIVVLTIEDNQLKVLLINRADEPFKGKWALPGGFLWEAESTKQAAERVLLDKGGVRDAYMEQLYTFDSPHRDPRGHIISVTYLALADREKLVIRSSKSTQQPTLYPLSALPALAFDHKEVVDYAKNRLKSKLQYTNLVFALLPAVFTFNQLQTAYEVVFGQSVDRRNFRKKYLSLGLIKPTGEQLSGGRHRPAELFMFNPRKPIELERWF
jgi:8-oxo-dGTP diphosphatase